MLMGGGWGSPSSYWPHRTSGAPRSIFSPFPARDCLAAEQRLELANAPPELRDQLNAIHEKWHGKVWSYGVRRKPPVPMIRLLADNIAGGASAGHPISRPR